MVTSINPSLFDRVYVLFIKWDDCKFIESKGSKIIRLSACPPTLTEHGLGSFVLVVTKKTGKLTL
jgi:hypothetical protein